MAASHDKVTTGFPCCLLYASPHVGATAWYIAAKRHYNPFWNTSTDAPVPHENDNRAPTLTAIGPKTIPENQLLSFTIRESDPDGDALTCAASPLPSGANFTSSTRTFSWTPSFTQAGSYPVMFTVSDPAGLSASETVTITVTDVPLKVSDFTTSLDYFSPNADGYADTTIFRGRFNRAASWRLTVKDQYGTLIRTFTGTTGTGTSFSQTWDGKTSAGLRTPDGRYVYTLTGTDAGGSRAAQAGVVWIDTIAPRVFSVSVSPNPFSPNADGVNDTTTIRFSLSEPAKVSLQIYSSAGAFIKTLLAANWWQTLTNSLTWNGTDSFGVRVPPGLYTYKLWVSDRANRAIPYPVTGTITVQ